MSVTSAVTTYHSHGLRTLCEMRPWRARRASNALPSCHKFSPSTFSETAGNRWGSRRAKRMDGTGRSTLETPVLCLPSLTRSRALFE